MPFLKLVQHGQRNIDVIFLFAWKGRTEYIVPHKINKHSGLGRGVIVYSELSSVGFM